MPVKYSTLTESLKPLQIHSKCLLNLNKHLLVIKKPRRKQSLPLKKVELHHGYATTEKRLPTIFEVVVAPTSSKSSRDQTGSNGRTGPRAPGYWMYYFFSWTMCSQPSTQEVMFSPRQHHNFHNNWFPRKYSGEFSFWNASVFVRRGNKRHGENHEVWWGKKQPLGRLEDEQLIHRSQEKWTIGFKGKGTYLRF